MRAGTRRSSRAVTLGRLTPHHWPDGPASPPPGAAFGWGPRSAEGVRGGEMERADQRAVVTRRVGEWVGLVRVVGRVTHLPIADKSESHFL